MPIFVVRNRDADGLVIGLWAGAGLELCQGAEDLRA